MKLLFVHDHRFVKIDNEFYSGGAFTTEVLKRYTSIAEAVTVAARIITQGDKSKLSALDTPTIKFVHAYIDIKRLTSLIKEHDGCIVRLPSKTGLLAIELAKKQKKPYLIELVGCPWDAYWNHSFAGKILAPLIWWLTKKAVRNADYVLYVSEKFLQGRYPTNGKSIACSDVQLNEFDEKTLKKRLARITDLKNRNEIVICTVAVVNVKYKGQQNVIKALSKLKKDGYSIKYKLVGGGDKTYLQNIAKKYNVLENVEFCGSVSHHQIFEFLDNIDLYIQPSLTEGLPRAVVEAMSRACPVIGSNVGGIPELIDEKYLFKKKNINDICNKIKNMLSEENMLAEARRSFNRATDFDIDKLNVKRNEFYTKFKNESEKING